MLRPARERTFAPVLGHMPVAGSRQLVEQRPGLFEIGCSEAFGEPVVDRREEFAGFGAAALVAVEAGEADSSAQFPEFGLLLLGNAHSFAVQLLGGFRVPLPQHELTFVPV